MLSKELRCNNGNLLLFCNWFLLCISSEPGGIHALLVLVIPLQTVPLLSIMHELDKCFTLCKGTVWRDITYNTLPRVGHYAREIWTTFQCATWVTCYIILLSLQIIPIIAITLNGANVVGYVKCRRDAGAKITAMAGQFIGRQILKQVITEQLASLDMY